MALSPMPGGGIPRRRRHHGRCPEGRRADGNLIRFCGPALVGQLIQKQKLGIHLPFKKIGSSSLLKAIKKTEQPEIREQVADMRERLAGENGVEATLELVRSYFLKKQD